MAQSKVPWFTQHSMVIFQIYPFNMVIFQYVPWFLCMFTRGYPTEVFPSDILPVSRHRRHRPWRPRLGVRLSRWLRNHRGAEGPCAPETHRLHQKGRPVKLAEVWDYVKTTEIIELIRSKIIVGLILVLYWSHIYICILNHIYIYISYS